MKSAIFGDDFVENEPDGPRCGAYLCAGGAGMPGRGAGDTYVDAAPSGTLLGRAAQRNGGGAVLSEVGTLEAVCCPGW